MGFLIFNILNLTITQFLEFVVAVVVIVSVFNEAILVGLEEQFIDSTIVISALT